MKKNKEHKYTFNLCPLSFALMQKKQKIKAYISFSKFYARCTACA